MAIAVKQIAVGQHLQISSTCDGMGPADRAIGLHQQERFSGIIRMVEAGEGVTEGGFDSQQGKNGDDQDE